MARVKLDLPAQFPFSTELEVRIRDINYGGHLGNDALLGLLHESRLRYLKSLGWTEMSICGAGLIMTDSVIVYKSEAYLGERLKIDIAIGDLNKYGFDFFYRVAKSDSGKEVARAKTGVVFFSYDRKKMTGTPEEFASRFGGIAPGPVSV